MQVENKNRNEPNGSNCLGIFPCVKSLLEAGPFLHTDQIARLFTDVTSLSDLFSIW